MRVSPLLVGVLLGLAVVTLGMDMDMDMDMEEEEDGFLAATEAVEDPVAPLWPLPRNYRSGASFSTISSKTFKFTTTSSSGVLIEAVHRYNHLIFKTTADATRFVCVAETAHDGALVGMDIKVQTDDETLSLETDEEYTLDVPVNGIVRLQSKTVYGALRGLETFSQLVSCAHRGLVVANTPWQIFDSPRFPHRGVLIDTSRHFLSIATIKRTIDALSYSKMNVLHWHIVDSQSFPFVSTSEPRLTSPYHHSLVYTPSDVGQIVDYAKMRGVRVIPEFDVPGHTYAWGVGINNLTVCGAAEPWMKYCAEPPCGQLDPTLENTYDVVSSLFKEVTLLFPDSVVHTGADEVNYNCWNSSEALRERMSLMDIDSFTGLLQHFESRLEAIVKSTGKTMMVWQEILDENIQVDVANTIIQVWKDKSSVSRAIAKGYRVVVSSSDDWYLDCGYGSFHLRGEQLV